MSFARRYWTQVHNWVGVVITPPLAVIVFTGIVLFFHDALSHWEFDRPHTVTLGQAMDKVAHNLEQQGSLKPGAVLAFYPNASGGFPLYYFGSKSFDAMLSDGTVVHKVLSGSANRTLLNIHYSLSLPLGIYIAGFISILMLVLLINGMVVHWPNLKRQFQQFRGDSVKDKWLDLHKLVGLATLPYLLMYALTGAVFCLISIYQGLLLAGPYHHDRTALMNELGFTQNPPASGKAAAQLAPSALLAQSQKLLEAQPYTLTIGPWKDAAEKVIASAPRGQQLIEAKEVSFSPGSDQAVAVVEQANMPAARYIYSGFSALHYGSFGGLTIILLFSVLGIALMAMLFAGALRANNKLKAGTWLYRYNRQCLVMAGSLPFATLLVLLAARYLPMDAGIRFWVFPWLFWVATLAPVLWPMAKGVGRRRVARLWWCSGALALLCLVSLLKGDISDQFSWLIGLAFGTVILVLGALRLSGRRWLVPLGQ
ncbi:PepSY-associated TM helix domain-containing protein [Gallaecimonas mangrovi]|uniref:PepSY-associated TM helix domain-containing protein n=1 Tax=Gallaecimonas mangrovi TaxID=2291597 RepID=UPI0018662F8B|nr:PepSY-associated TM helix domain-containing protein [Gallaecimonas mangrovi]